MSGFGRNCSEAQGIGTIHGILVASARWSDKIQGNCCLGRGLWFCGGVDTRSRTLDFYTDGRSAKVCSLLDPNVTPRVCWLFYRHETRVQVRVDGRCEILARDQAEEYWKSTPSDSHKLYATKDPPGTRMENQLPNDPEYDFDRAQDHFFVVRTRVENIDLVSLSSKGNRRLTIEYEDLSLPARLSWRTP